MVYCLGFITDAVSTLVIPVLFRTLFEGLSLFGTVAAGWFFLGKCLGCVAISMAFVTSSKDCIRFNFTGLPVYVDSVCVWNEVSDFSA